MTPPLLPNGLTVEENKRQADAFWNAGKNMAETHFGNAGLEIKNHQPPPQNSWRLETPITSFADAQRGVNVLMGTVRERGGITKAYNCYVLITGDPQNPGLKIGAYFV